jgi:hypothetical protein
MDSNGRETLAARVKARVLAAAEVLAATVESAEDSSWREKIPELQDTQWLADILEREPPRRQRWPLIAIFVITAVALLWLLDPPGSIPVLIRATTTDIAFAPLASTASSDIYLIPAEMSVNSLELYGLLTSIPPGSTKSDGVFATPEWRNSRIEHVYLVMRPDQIPKVTLEAQASNGVRLCAEGGDLYIDFAGNRGNDAYANDEEIQLHLAPYPTRNTGKENDEVCVRWESGSADAATILSNLSVTDLHVSGTELVVAGEDDRSDVFPSALKSAQLTFPKAPGLKQTFERDERLGLKDFRGRLRSVALSKGSLEVRSIGDVSRVTRSYGFVERDITPSRLAVLRARYSEVWFAWGLLLYLIGLVTAFFKWRGVEL